MNITDEKIQNHLLVIANTEAGDTEVILKWVNKQPKEEASCNDRKGIKMQGIITL